ncbi:zinc ribbon domain-containing protein [Salinimicrobium terrae]|uniref:zinc ribbon domain-containing protein n=1 Tax=Salinimicrobium terrae TaxID=470866 RepID=UPI00048DEC0B|nr:zinc ribbon domain-containing protein [Salinimicrobium terrae]
MRPFICQCCGLPFSPKIRGTNRDQSLSSDYCLDCFKNGEFRDHHLTIQDMEKKLLIRARHHDEISLEEAHDTIKILPDLKRWRMTHIL